MAARGFVLMVTRVNSAPVSAKLEEGWEGRRERAARASTLFSESCARATWIIRWMRDRSGFLTLFISISGQLYFALEALVDGNRSIRGLIVWFGKRRYYWSKNKYGKRAWSGRCLFYKLSQRKQLLIGWEVRNEVPVVYFISMDISGWSFDVIKLKKKKDIL